VTIQQIQQYIKYKIELNASPYTQIKTHVKFNLHWYIKRLFDGLTGGDGKCRTEKCTYQIAGLEKQQDRSEKPSCPDGFAPGPVVFPALELSHFSVGLLHFPSPYFTQGN